jgi:hypothetical protein
MARCFWGCNPAYDDRSDFTQLPYTGVYPQSAPTRQRGRIQNWHQLCKELSFYSLVDAKTKDSLAAKGINCDLHWPLSHSRRRDVWGYNPV